ncbi:MAG: hypothetical protein B6U69_02260 [Thermofilum sp. ex4484_15]|nr:MAG: hypothetical protein B6U69_02260 [Thermofilum sp. ex4484_15]
MPPLKLFLEVVKLGRLSLALVFDSEGYLVSNTVPLPSEQEVRRFTSLKLNRSKLVNREVTERGRDIASSIFELYKGKDVKVDVKVKFLWLKRDYVSILTSLKKIGKGEVVSYKCIARAFSLPNARVAGIILSLNPFPLIYPCHRVVRSDGSIGGYLGSSKYRYLKMKILSREGVEIREGRVLRKYFRESEFLKRLSNKPLFIS